MNTYEIRHPESGKRYRFERHTDVFAVTYSQGATWLVKRELDAAQTLSLYRHLRESGYVFAPRD